MENLNWQKVLEHAFRRRQISHPGVVVRAGIINSDAFEQLLAADRFG